MDSLLSFMLNILFGVGLSLCIVYLDGGRSPGLGPPLLHKGGVRLRLGVLHQERLVLTNQQTELDRATLLTNQQTELDRANILTNQQSESDDAKLLANQQSELIPLKLVLRIQIRTNFEKPVTDPHQSEKPDPDLHRSLKPDPGTASKSKSGSWGRPHNGAVVVHKWSLGGVFRPVVGDPITLMWKVIGISSYLINTHLPEGEGHALLLLPDRPSSP